MSFKQILSQNWIMSHVGGPAETPTLVRRREIPATVPGCVHTDLLAAGLIPNPYFGTNEGDLQWIGDSTWEYRCEFDSDPRLFGQEHLELVCHGLDTIASVQLNGAELGRTENMHVVHRFDVRKMLRPGLNRLVIRFFSPVHYAREMERRLGPLPHTMPHLAPWNFIRKMACNFGWDWGPVLTTSGIWQPVEIVGWDGARIAGVIPSVPSASASEAEVRVRVDLEGSAGFDSTLQLRFVSPEGVEVARENRVLKRPSSEVTLTISRPQLWWPKGFGSPHLYTLEISLVEGGVVTDVWMQRIGLRTARIVAEPDAIGRSWYVEINGKPIYVKGANWIPDDCFVSRVTEDRYRERLTQALDANMNTVRVWGGGLYESGVFYNLCDEMGLMVFQDFLFVCACYPEEEPLRSLVLQEVRQQIVRLARHPSLVVWSGCNECFVAMEEWGWKSQFEPGGPCAGRTWGADYYLNLLPSTLQELDPTRAYWPASPYSGSAEIPCASPDHGTNHIWDVSYEEYRKYVPRFVAEFGHSGPPPWSTLTKSIPLDTYRMDSPALHYHQRGAEGIYYRVNVPISTKFDLPREMTDWHYLAQLVQARSVTCGLEWWRIHRPRCMGTIIWQLNDCWPAVSWAAIDAAGKKKPLWHAVRRAYANHLLVLAPKAGELRAFAVNDGLDPWRLQVQLSRFDFEGNNLASYKKDIVVLPESVLPLGSVSSKIGQPTSCNREFVLLEGGGSRAAWFYLPDRNLAYPRPEFELQLRGQSGGQTRLAIRAHTLLREWALFADRIAPNLESSDQLLTLLPGESAEFSVAGEWAVKEVDMSTLQQRPYSNCANFHGLPQA